MTDVLDTAAALTDAIALPIWFLTVDPDDQFRFRQVNALAQDAFGMHSARLVGLRPEECLPSPMAAALTENCRTCLNRRGVHSYEAAVSRSVGKTWWQVSLSPVFDGEDAVGVIGISLEITARKAHDRRSEKSFEDLNKLNRELCVFTAMAAHDLRSPLRKIGVMTDMIAASLERSQNEEIGLVHTCKEVVSKALVQLDDVLSYARALTLERTPATTVDFGEMCRELIVLLDPERRLKFYYPEATIEVESVLLQVVLRNLIDNAVKFARHEVHLTVDSDLLSDDHLAFTIADDGAGFSDPSQVIGQAPRIEMASKTSGFGLAAVSHLVESRGGGIWIKEPRFSTGATLKWTLEGRFVQTTADSEHPELQRAAS